MSTEKSKFDLYGIKRRVYAWEKSAEVLNNECVDPTIKDARTSVIVWGYFRGERTGDSIPVYENHEKKVNIIRFCKDITKHLKNDSPFSKKTSQNSILNYIKIILSQK